MHRFHHLQEAILLNRIDMHQIQVVLPEGGIQLVKSPLNHLGSLEILGTRIWFHASDSPWEHRNVWELAELDAGHLVCVNPSSVRSAVHQALLEQKITPLEGYITQPGVQNGHNFVLMSDESVCMVAVESVLRGDDIGRGFFPGGYDPTLEFRMRALMQAHLTGQRAVLILGVPHNGIKNVFVSDHIDAQIGGMLQEGHQKGLEILCMHLEVNPTGLKTGQPLPLKVLQGAHTNTKY